MDCEAKEEKLVTDAVKHLNQANLQIHSMSKRIIDKSEESQKQKQEIAHLLTQVKKISCLICSPDLKTNFDFYKIKIAKQIQ